MLTQQSPIHVWVYHHIATLPLKRKLFLNLMGPLQDHLWPYTKDSRLYLCHEPLPRTPRTPVHTHSILTPCTFVLTPRTLVQAHAMNFCLLLKGPSSILAPYTFVPLLQGPLFVLAPLHHTTHHHQLLYHLLRRLILFEESFSKPISMLRHHSTQKLKPMALGPTLLY